MQIEDGKSYVLFKMDRRSEGRGDTFFINNFLKEKKRQNVQYVYSQK